MRRIVSLLAAVMVVGLLAGCGAARKATTTKADTLGPNARFADLERPTRTVSLFTLFNSQARIPRVVLLISPT